MGSNAIFCEVSYAVYQIVPISPGPEGNELGSPGYGIPPAHPAKANQGQGQPACGIQALVQTLELLFELSNAALLQPIIPKQNFPDSFFYHIPPNTPTGNVSQGETSVNM